VILQLRGTSGSGKSTAMRAFMSLVEETSGPWTPAYAEGRKKPLYYRHLQRRLAVLGHYESQCGGTDTIGSAREVFELIQSLPAKIEHVICEGLLLSEDVKWTSRLPDCTVLFLNTPLETCLRQIEGRRKEKGNEKPLDPKNTVNRVATIERARVRLTEAGVRCIRCSPRQAPGKILELLPVMERV
jgi:hypothetical protein